MKKLFILITIAFLIFSCKDDLMNEETQETAVNPLAGVWAAGYMQSGEIYTSVIQFNDNRTFIYTVQHENDVIAQFSGNYTYNDFTIIFEIQEPELSVTHSTYHIVNEDKLYCRGEKLLYSDNLHNKMELPN